MENVYMYGCPKCKSVFSIGMKEPVRTLKCPDCETTLTYLGYTKEKWGALTDTEKDSIKRKMLPETSTDAIQNEFLSQIAADIHTIKNIVVFCLIISIISALITIF